MKLLIIFSLLFFNSSTFSQYYYNDIVVNQQNNNQFQLLKLNQIKTMIVHGFDAENKPSELLSFTQKFTIDYKSSSTYFFTNNKSNSPLITLYENNKIKQTTSYDNAVETQSSYTYDENGILQKIISNSSDTTFFTNAIEAHIWVYLENKQPTFMLKIKNNTDTTKIEFIRDEKGNIIEEHWKKKNELLETYYYYYNEKNLLTDIVRFNKRVQKLLPNFLFEYNNQNQVIAVTQVPANNSNYLTWKYNYNDKGLKKEEIYQNKQKQLIGRIEYVYE